MLPAHLVADNGLSIIDEYPELTSNIRLHVGDLTFRTIFEFIKLFELK